MSLLPKRSLRLTGQPTDYYQRFTGSSGEIYYDKTLETLRVFPGNVSVGKVVAAFDLGGRLPLGSGAGAIYANQTTGSITIGDYIGTSGQPQAPSTVIQVGGATNAFAISAYGPPSVGWQFGRNGALTLPGDIKSNGNINIEINLADSTLQKWQFGEDGLLTFPDGTNQSTAWLGAGTPVFTNLIDSQDSTAITVVPAIIFNSDVTVENDLVAKNIVNNGQFWQFGTDGNLTVPGDIIFPNNGSYIEDSESFFVATNGDFQIQTNKTLGQQDWTFGANGTLTAPGSVVAPNIFTNLIDSQDSSAITVTPSAIFSSDVTVENDLLVKNITLMTVGGGGTIKEGLAPNLAGGTIILTPAFGANDNQALVIYPTAGEGNHIHLTANGGTTELYLGDDNQYVKLVNGGNVEVRSTTSGSTAAWIFDTEGRLTFPAFPFFVIPEHSYGKAGDTAGMVIIDDTYIYYCTADYVNNATNIWKRTPHAAGTW